MSRWLITYTFRLHKRPRDGIAIFMDSFRGRGPITEIIPMHPVEWLERENERWAALEHSKLAGEAMTDITVLYAIVSPECERPAEREDNAH